MFFLKILIFAAGILLFAAGCSSPTPNVVYAPPQVDDETKSARLAEFARVLEPCATRGFIIRPEKLRELYYAQPDAMIQRLRESTINRLYLLLQNRESLEIAGLRNVLEAIAEAGIPVEAILPESSYFHQPRESTVLEFLFPGGISLEEMVEELHDLESDTFRFAGFTVFAQPHLFTKANTKRPKTLLYAWDEKHYGPGKDNDMLMKLTLEKIDEFARAIGDTPLTVGIPDYYEELVMEGKLTCGGTADFGKSASKIIIIGTGNKPSALLESVRNELKNAPADSLLISVALADHTSVTEGALRRRNWNDYIRSLTYAINEWKQSPAFNGVILGPLIQVETLLQEK